MRDRSAGSVTGLERVVREVVRHDEPTTGVDLRPAAVLGGGAGGIRRGRLELGEEAEVDAVEFDQLLEVGLRDLRHQVEERRQGVLLRTEAVVRRRLDLRQRHLRVVHVEAREVGRGEAVVLLVVVLGELVRPTDEQVATVQLDPAAHAKVGRTVVENLAVVALADARQILERGDKEWERRRERMSKTRGAYHRNSPEEHIRPAACRAWCRFFPLTMPTSWKFFGSFCRLRSDGKRSRPLLGIATSWHSTVSSARK